jgi:hypothetical protein
MVEGTELHGPNRGNAQGVIFFLPSINEFKAGWMVLNNLLGELKSKGVFIPDLTYADLRNSKMVLEYLSTYGDEVKAADPCDTELEQEMELKILRLKDTMLIWAEQKEGMEYRQSWEKRFDDAIHGNLDVEMEVPETSISDIPREKDIGFFRIKLPEDIPVEIISELAEYCGVLIDLDGERHLKVSGKRDCVRDALKRLGNIFYGESKLN